MLTLEDTDFAAFRAQRRRMDVFWPLADLDVKLLLAGLHQENRLNLGKLDVAIVRPGDPLFDHHEIQNKLYLRCKDFEDYKKRLAGHGLTWPLPRHAESAELLFNVALAEGVPLDGCMAGFMYNIGCKCIMVAAIPQNRVMQMAASYAQKERDNLSFTKPADAKLYLELLAHKYFFHEVGHFLYRFLLNESERTEWASAVRQTPGVAQRVCEIQEDKHPSRDAVPVDDEAFADIFTALTAPSRMKRRLGEQRRLESLSAAMLESHGARF